MTGEWQEAPGASHFDIAAHDHHALGDSVVLKLALC